MFSKNLARFHAVYPTSCSQWKYPFDIHPATFSLPKEYAQFIDAFESYSENQHSSESSNVWIVKPTGLSRGRGIHLIHDPLDVDLGSHSIVQRYICNPMTIGGYKFDLRVYVLVTSFNPLEAWIYQQGFARFATEKFALDKENLSNPFSHITNVAIQNDNNRRTADKDESLENPFKNKINRGSSKMSLTDLWQVLEDKGLRTNDIWVKCKQAVLVALFVSQVGIPHQVSYQIWFIRQSMVSSLAIIISLIPLKA